jgi:hypothetical protein
MSVISFDTTVLTMVAFFDALLEHSFKLAFLLYGPADHGRFLERRVPGAYMICQNFVSYESSGSSSST